MNEIKKEEVKYHYSDKEETFSHWYLRSKLDSLLKKIQANHSAPLRILEIGSGNGEYANYLNGKGFSVVGMEPSLEGCEIAKREFGGVRFIQQSIYDDVPHDLKNSFDLIVAVEVIEHLPYPQKFFEKVKAYIKPSGHLILTTPFHGYIKNLAISLLNGWDRHFSVGWVGGHIKFYSPKSLTSLLTEAGFKDTSFVYAGRFPWLWKSMISLSHKP